MKNTSPLILAAVCMLLATVYAQEPDPQYSHAVKVSGTNKQITVFTGAPAGFDPETASVEALASYGYPRRPDFSDKQAYSRWVREVSTTRVDVATLSVDPTISHQLHGMTKGPTTANTANAFSGNWSGYSLVGSGPKFDEVVGDWIVPSVNYQFSNIDGFSSMWVGIDGNCSCKDLIQDGTDQQVHADGSVNYHAWIEFIPQNEVPIPNFAVHPGDAFGAITEVVIVGGNVFGKFFMTNFTTRTSFSGQLAMPAGDAYVGATAEWIVERSQINGSFNNPMPNYGFAFMDAAWAYRQGSSKKIPFASGANQNITMTSDGSPGGTKLSSVSAYGPTSMWFQWLAY